MDSIRTWRGILEVVQALPRDRRRMWWHKVSGDKLCARQSLIVLAHLVDEGVMMPEEVQREQEARR